MPIGGEEMQAGSLRSRRVLVPVRPVGVESLNRQLLHGVGLDGEALAGPHLLAFALELTAGGEDVAPARRADGRGVAGIEDDVGEGLDRLPVRAFVEGAGPGVEG